VPWFRTQKKEKKSAAHAALHQIWSSYLRQEWINAHPQQGKDGS
jgi:hypothetical protein